MRAFDFVRVVLYDKSTATREPLVLYDASAGLTGRDLMRATKHFEFLLNHDFKLYRTSGDLGIDPKGDQRMEMIGIHNRMRNARAAEQEQEAQARRHQLQGPKSLMLPKAVPGLDISYGP